MNVQILEGVCHSLTQTEGESSSDIETEPVCQETPWKGGNEEPAVIIPCSHFSDSTFCWLLLQDSLYNRIIIIEAEIRQGFSMFVALNTIWLA